MRSLIAALLLVFAWSAHGQTTYFFANAGNDSNACTSPSAPCQTIAHANSLISTTTAGNRVLFKGGDVWHETLYCGSAYENALGSGKNTANNPPPCHGVILGSYGTGRPIIDAADPICPSGSWTLVSGQTAVYQCSLPSGSPDPWKLYVDPTFTNLSLNAAGTFAAGSSPLQQQLLAIPTLRGGAGSCTGTANYLDAFGSYYNKNGEAYLLYNNQPGQASCATALVVTGPVDQQTAQQGFNTATVGNSATANVAKGAAYYAPQVLGFGYPTYPGAWSISGDCPSQGCTVYVNLADGTNPNGHAFEATHRKYGIWVEGTNDVTVSGFTVAHCGEVCIVGQPYSRYEQMLANFTVTNNVVFNCGSADYLTTLPQADGTSNGTVQGCIGLEANVAQNPPLSKYPNFSGNYVGTLDSPFGNNNGFIADIFALSFDGNGATCVICKNIVNPTASTGILDTEGPVLSKPMTLPANMGGIVRANNVSNFQTGISAGGINGQIIEGNKIFEGYGQGIQLGGSSTGVECGDTAPCAGSVIIRFNLIANLGLNAALGDYNGLDCNSASSKFTGIWYYNNAIYNVYAAGATFEQAVDPATLIQAPGVGCLGVHFYDNVIDQNATLFGNGTCNPIKDGTAYGKCPSGVEAIFGGRNPNWRSQADSVANNSTVFYLNPTVYGNGLSLNLQNNWYLESSGVTDVGSYGRTCAIMQQEFNDTTDHCAAADPQFTNPLPTVSGGTSDVTLKATSPLIGAGKSGFSTGNIGAYISTSPFGFTSALLGGAIQ